MALLANVPVYMQVEEVPYTRLCGTKNILTVNGQFPGPTLYAYKGETIIVDVYNKAKDNITIHWYRLDQFISLTKRLVIFFW